MSRSGYSYDYDCQSVNLWRGAVESAIRGKRGQTLLRSLRDALDAMPEKRLIAEELVQANGECCALGAVALKKGINVEGVDPEDRNSVANLFNIAPALAAEIVYENDEGSFQKKETPEERWARMSNWVDANLKKQLTDLQGGVMEMEK